MITRLQTGFRFIPPKVNALLLTLLFLVVPLAIFTIILNSDDSVVTVNGIIVTGDERQNLISDMNRTFSVFLLPAMLVGVWTARRLLPGSPLDYFEVGPNGLSVRGIFGLYRFPWDEIADVKVRLIPGSSIPFAWMTIRLVTGRARQFYFSGYLRIKLFTDLGEQTGEISDWFSQVKSAYTKGNQTGSLPALPWGLIGRTVTLEEAIPATQSSGRPVIERRDV